MGDGGCIVRAIRFAWDGKHLPEELAQLPPGEYVATLIEDVTDLTPEEDAGIRAALDSIEAGHVRPLDDVILEIRTRARRR
jgi:hypothetical protein